MPKLTKANQQYIKDNADKLGIVELCENTGLSASTIANFVKKLQEEPVAAVEPAPASQHDTNVAPAKPKKSDAIKRMTPTKGVTVMTPEMAEKADRPRKTGLTSEFAKSIHRIYADG